MCACVSPRYLDIANLWNLDTALIIGEFRNRHPDCYSLMDMCATLWFHPGGELVGTQILVWQVLATAGGIVSTSTVFGLSFVSAGLMATFSSVLTSCGWAG